MTVIELLPIKSALPLGELVERQDLGVELQWSVTTSNGIGQARRRWFGDRAAALAHAADQSDAYGLPLIDLSDRDGEG